MSDVNWEREKTITKTKKITIPAHEAMMKEVFWHIARRGYTTTQDIAFDFGTSMYSARLLLKRLKQRGHLHLIHIAMDETKARRAVYGVDYQDFYWCKDCSEVWIGGGVGTWGYCPSCGGTNVVYDEGERKLEQGPEAS